MFTMRDNSRQPYAWMLEGDVFSDLDSIKFIRQDVPGYVHDMVMMYIRAQRFPDPQRIYEEWHAAEFDECVTSLSEVLDAVISEYS